MTGSHHPSLPSITSGLPRDYLFRFPRSGENISNIPSSPASSSSSSDESPGRYAGTDCASSSSSGTRRSATSTSTSGALGRARLTDSGRFALFSVAFSRDATSILSPRLSVRRSISLRADAMWSCSPRSRSRSPRPGTSKPSPSPSPVPVRLSFSKDSSPQDDSLALNSPWSFSPGQVTCDMRHAKEEAQQKETRGT